MPTIVSQVSASNHDCLVYKDGLGNWQLDLTHNEVTVGYFAFWRKGQGAGLYFPNVPIPPGSTIHGAFLILRCSNDRVGEGVSSLIKFEDNANPSPFSTLADYQARPWSLILQWWLFKYKEWNQGVLYASPDISELIQRVIDLPAWAEGNPIALSWNDHAEKSFTTAQTERIAYSYDDKPDEAPRLEITFTPPGPPPPPPPPPLPPPPPPPRKGWAGLDLQYEYLDDGFKLTFHTDVPCHLFCRMTTTPPRRHSLPTMRRGLRMTGDIRFCFTVYEDNEQEEAGDTLIHTFVKDAWPICETRWFYFIGFAYGDPSPSESPIFKFHFPAPPPEPPPPIEKIFIASPDNRTLWFSHGNWATAHNTAWGNIHPWWELPNAKVFAGDSLTASYWFWRCAMDFPPLALPATAKIVSALISLYVTAIYRTDNTRPWLYVTQGVQQLPPINTDYGAQLPYTDILGLVDIFNLTLNAYNDIPFTGGGLAILDNSAKNRFCLRGQNDVESYISVPRYDSWIQFHSQQKDAGYWPLLKVQYYPA